jgi:hypothetical protein
MEVDNRGLTTNRVRAGEVAHGLPVDKSIYHLTALVKNNSGEQLFSSKDEHCNISLISKHCNISCEFFFNEMRYLSKKKRKKKGSCFQVGRNFWRNIWFNKFQKLQELKFTITWKKI